MTAGRGATEGAAHRDRVDMSAHDDAVDQVHEMSEGTVRFEIRGHTAWVTLDRPEARNAVTGRVSGAVEAAVDHVEASDDLWVGVLTGTGPVFSAGADLKEVAAGRGDTISSPKGGFAGFVAYPRTRVWIAAVNGLALGGGLELTLACDMAVAVDTAAFGLPEVARGIMAGAGGVFRLPRALPRAIALELVATGGRLSAQRAVELGLINRVVPADQLTVAARELADAVCSNAPIAVRESVAVARDAYLLSDDEGWDRSHQAVKRVMATTDAIEGPLAFVEKRAPQWTGR
jgi:enoyl-CoA hydratase/carnithine racemase